MGGGRLDPPREQGVGWGSVQVPKGHPGRRLGEVEAVPGAVCLCLQGRGPVSQGESRWWQRGGFPAPKVPLSPFQVWGGPKGFPLHVHSRS